MSIIQQLDNLVLQLHNQGDLLSFFLAMLQVGLAIGALEAALFAFFLDGQRKTVDDYWIRSETRRTSVREKNLAGIHLRRYETMILLSIIMLCWDLFLPIVLAILFFLFPAHLASLSLLLLFGFSVNIDLFILSLFSLWRDEKNLVHEFLPNKAIGYE